MFCLHYLNFLFWIPLAGSNLDLNNPYQTFQVKKVGFRSPNDTQAIFNFGSYDTLYFNFKYEKMG